MNDHQSQYRHDPLQKRWVIIASERGRRPDDFQQPSVSSNKQFCPFCPGQEGSTPPEILAIPNKEKKGKAKWQVRVVPNKFPALRVEGQPTREADGIYDRMIGVGAHEVVIETPDHDSLIADRSEDEVSAMLRVFRERIRDLRNDQRLRYVLVFKNHGAVAGCSLSHPHSQIMATTTTPKTVETELSACREHFELKERCLVCDIIKQEIHDRSRIISIDDRFIAFCPYASRFPFELFVTPRYHQHDYALSSDHDLQALARILGDTFARLKRALHNPPYNLVLHTSPNVHAVPKKTHYWANIEVDFHWHIEILPRLTRVAGFEWGTGYYVNPTPPEDAAEFLRQV